ncbi:DUF6538 domain-containing protein [Sphingopyxis sp.]|uniref:DUF6538 domain-containing protein n=1 Tax=Sphingopyxis sp. TaxID=1908224 RepID=UPI003BAAE2FF
MKAAWERVSGHPYLYLRGTRYVARVQIPRDVRAQIGKSEFKRSFGGDGNVAKRKYHAFVAECLGAISVARNSNGRTMEAPDPAPVAIDHARIEAACYAHFKRMATSMRGKVADPVGENPRARLSRAEGFKVILESLLDAFEQDAWYAVAADAIWLSEEVGWDIGRNHPSFEFLCRTLLRAKIQTYRNEIRFIEVNLGRDENIDPLFGPKPPKSSAERKSLGNLIDKFVAERSGSWSGSTKKNYVIIIRVLEEICGRETSVAEVDKDFCRNVRSILSRIPANYQKFPATKGRPIEDVIAIGESLDLPLIGPATINGHLNKLGAVIRFGRDEGWIVGNPMAKVEVSDPVHPSEKRDPFSVDHLKAIFAAEPWNARYDPKGDNPSRYWAPLISLFTGARLTEICGQLVDEMIEVEGVFAFNFAHRPSDRSIKGGKSRIVPVHQRLLELGFWDFVVEARKNGRSQLFPDVKRDRLGKWGDGTSKWFSRKVRSVKRRSNGTPDRRRRRTPLRI